MAFTVNTKAFCVLEFAKTESIVTVQRRFRIVYHTEPPTDKTIREWYMNSSRVAACSFRSAKAATLLEFLYHSRIVLSVGGLCGTCFPRARKKKSKFINNFGTRPRKVSPAQH